MISERESFWKKERMSKLHYFYHERKAETSFNWYDIRLLCVTTSGDSQNELSCCASTFYGFILVLSQNKIETDGQIDGRQHIDGQTDRQIDSQADRRHTNSHKCFCLPTLFLIHKERQPILLLTINWTDKF